MNYNIVDLGASPDGKLCTESIQKAIDECYLSGGGEVIVPCGRFLTGGLRIRSGVKLHLMEGARLVGSTDPEDYLSFLEDKIEPIKESDLEKTVDTVMTEAKDSMSAKPYSRWNNAIIRGINAKNIAIIGEKNSYIDGRNCFDELGEEKYRGPHAINLWFCENVRLSGYTVKDSANWAHAIHNSQNIEVDGITVLGGHDGFDIRTCDNVKVENSVFYTGDDSIAGFDNINVVVRNCVLNSSCSAMRFGGTDVLVENCTSTSPNKYGFRGNMPYEKRKEMAQADDTCRHNCVNAFLYYCDFRAKIRKTPGNILIKNCSFKNASSVFLQAFGHRWACNKALDSITFEDCTFEGLSLPINILCPENEPLTFKMKNCRMSPRDDARDIPILEAINFRDIIFENVSVSGFTSPRIIYCTAGNIDIKNSSPIKLEKGDNISRCGH